MAQKQTINFILLLFTAGCFLMTTGCNKDDEGGKPVISRIRAIAPAPNDSILTKAGPGQTIVIQGKNLATTSEIYFNGYRATFNSALFSDENVVATIPADMPFATLSQNKLNIITIVNKFGVTDYSFPIVPPAPLILAMSNEMALPGERVTILGNNFFFVDKVVFPGNLEVTSGITTNAAGNLLEVTVPNVTTGGSIKVVNRYGTGTSVLLFNDLTTGVLCNFDNVNTFSWGSNIISDATAFPGNRAKYSRLKQDNIPANNWDWWNGNRGIITNQVNWVTAGFLNNPAGDFSMKFEVFVKEPWTTGVLFIGPPPNDDWQYLYRFEPWKTVPGFKTNSWVTVIVPLNEFRKKEANGTNGTGDRAVTVGNIVGSIDEVVKFMFVNDTGTPIAKFDMAVDNIRVVRNF